VISRVTCRVAVVEQVLGSEYRGDVLSLEVCLWIVFEHCGGTAD
jgi:hypothetical protein